MVSLPLLVAARVVLMAFLPVGIGLGLILVFFAELATFF